MNLVVAIAGMPLRWRTRFFIRNHFISHLVLDGVKLKKLLELQGKSQEPLNKSYIAIATWFNEKLYQNNVSMILF